MPISSPLRTGYSSKSGFTLTELLISCAIIALVSTIVLVKYGSFDSTVLLKSAAYEIALTLREAQVRSVSVSGEGGEFSYPYGVTFTPEQKVYRAFRFEDPLEYPYFDISEPSPYAVVVPQCCLWWSISSIQY